ncbi:MmcQ/YjbR family DNA-binding protein [Thalassotalea mangrovi]|uniref:MmcQ/YjbR family DNA-binding protein n=1 Tax=Thalassotalea mangrovi TaxID=2572245 RepID=A0A4U1B859_9GAMM|nr:MmcQ/YjbR family DNA-binding protein [Thalassotalea mangrovi]TKB46747.1 MmcQ/YjbR family DNA-binding protein [Thalassotalea mangrovi]
MPEHIRNYLLNRPFTEMQYPFGEGVEVYKVKGKMFATLSLGKLGKGGGGDDAYWWMNLKCDPDEAIMLRDIFRSIIPGYHMNKRLWNTVILDGSVPIGEIERMIDSSFDLVVASLKKVDRQAVRLYLEKD